MFRENNKKISDNIDNSLRRLPTLVREKNMVEIEQIVRIASEHDYNWSVRDNSCREVKQALTEAIESEQNDIVIFLASSGIKGKIDGMHLLSYMSAKNNVEMVKQLVKLYKPLTSNTEHNALDIALIFAVDSGATEAANILLESGAHANITFRNVNYDCDHRWILGAAAANGHLEIAANLIKHGASIEYAILGVMIDLNRLINTYRVKERNELNARQATLNQEYRQTIKTLLDLAIGTNFELNQYNSERHDNTRKLQFIKEGMDISGFNFVGLSIDGHPIRREDLEKYNIIGLDNAFFTVKDWKENLLSFEIGRMRNKSRYDSLTKRLHDMQKLRGELVCEDDVIDVVPLNEAVLYGNDAAVRARINAGMDPNDRSYGPEALIIKAAKRRDKNVVATLLASSKISVAKSDIMLALKQTSDKEIAAQLKQHIPYDQQDPQKNTLLHYAAAAGDTDEISRLLKLGVKVSAQNNKQQTPLHFAVGAGHLPAVELLATKEAMQVKRDFASFDLITYRREDLTLIEEFAPTIRKANINILTFLLNKCAEWNLSVDYIESIKLAIACSNPTAVEILLTKVDKKEDWDTGLMLLIEWNCLEEGAFALILEKLLEHRVDINKIGVKSPVADIIEQATQYLKNNDACCKHNNNDRLAVVLNKLAKFYESPLKLLASINACFAETENKEELITSFKAALQPYGNDAGQSFVQLLSLINIHTPTHKSSMSISRRM